MISEERQSRFAHLLVDVWYNDDLVDFVNDDEDNVVRITKRSIAKWLAQEADIDGVVREGLASLKKKLIEGTPEWDIMYRKYYEQEMNRRG